MAPAHPSPGAPPRHWSCPSQLVPDRTTDPSLASQPRDRSCDRKCPPTQTAPPFPAAPSLGPGHRPRIPGLEWPLQPAGAARRRPRSSARAAVPPTPRAAGPRRTQKEGARGQRPPPQPTPSTPIAGTLKVSAHPKAPDAKERTPPPRARTFQAPPARGGLPRRPNHPAAGAPGRTITLKLRGRARGQGGGAPKRRKAGLGSCFFIFAKSTFRVAPRSSGLAKVFPRLLPAPRGPRAPRALPRPPPVRSRAPASAPRGSGRTQHSPRPGCAPRGPAPSPINGML